MWPRTTSRLQDASRGQRSVQDRGPERAVPRLGKGLARRVEGLRLLLPSTRNIVPQALKNSFSHSISIPRHAANLDSSQLPENKRKRPTYPEKLFEALPRRKSGDPTRIDPARVEDRIAALSERLSDPARGAPGESNGPLLPAFRTSVAHFISPGIRNLVEALPFAAPFPRASAFSGSSTSSASFTSSASCTSPPGSHAESRAL
jgi:hypothetical protein